MMTLKRHILTNEGFVLAMTLWVLVAITLGASFFALWSNRVVVESLHVKEELAQDMSMASTKAVLLYLLATQRMGIDGLHVPSELMEDGQVVASQPAGMSASLRVSGPYISLADQSYYGINNTVFSVQDEAGLLGLNNFDRTVMKKMLSQFAVPTIEQGPLLDKLLDYQDKNSLHRLNGAEAPEYEKQGLQPPADRYLFTSWETKSVMDWRDYKSLWQDGAFPRLTTVARAGTPNFNTAPSMVLQALPNIDEQVAEDIIAARIASPFTSVTDITAAAKQVLPIDSLGLIFFPTKNQRISIWHPSGVRLREIHVLLTPSSANGAPWMINHELLMPLPDSVRQNPVEKSEIVFFQTEIFQ